MPSHQLLRRDSWPPTVVHLTEDADDIIADMDENPFSYFLETPAHDFDDLDLDLSAGIESNDDHHNPDDVREVSPSSLQRLPTSTAAELDEHARLERAMHSWLAAPLSLRDFTRNHHLHKPRKSQRIPADSSSARGRGIVRLTPPLSRGARARSRSLSSQRPHSWREPSPEIGSIAEEDEQGDARMEEAPALSDATPEPEEVRRQAEPAKRKSKSMKRVRWAALPVEK